MEDSPILAELMDLGVTNSVDEKDLALCISPLDDRGVMYTLVLVALLLDNGACALGV